MTHRLSRRTLLGGTLGAVGVTGFSSAAPSARAQADPPPPLVACAGDSLAQDYTVIFHNPDRNLYVEGCGMTRLPDGTLVAVVPVVPSATKGGWAARPSTTHIMRSRDGGRTWNRASQLPYYTAIPWVHESSLYLFACKAGTAFRNDDLFLLRSQDGGRTWTDPVLLLKGHYWTCHCGMVQRRDRLYWALCDFYGSEGTEPRSPVVLAGDLTRDPLDLSAWRKSNRPPFPGIPASLGPSQRGSWLEQSVIEVEGQLRVVCRVRAGASITNLAAVLDLEDDGESMELKFAKFQPLPGGHLKFSIIYDAVSRLFWATANPGTRYTDRRFLMLMHSLDGLNWLPAGCIAAARSLEESFMYGYCMVDGDDMIAISRTSSGADGMHNADYATFHRVPNFRRLPLPLAAE